MVTHVSRVSGTLFSKSAELEKTRKSSKDSSTSWVLESLGGVITVSFQSVPAIALRTLRKRKRWTDSPTVDEMV